MQKLYENFHIFHFQKRMVSDETIRGNTICERISDLVYGLVGKCVTVFLNQTIVGYLIEITQGHSNVKKPYTFYGVPSCLQLVRA